MVDIDLGKIVSFELKVMVLCSMLEWASGSLPVVGARYLANVLHENGFSVLPLGLLGLGTLCWHGCNWDEPKTKVSPTLASFPGVLIWHGRERTPGAYCHAHAFNLYPIIT